MLIVSPTLSQETVFFGTKIFLLLRTISSSSSFLAAVPGMSSFWLRLDFEGQGLCKRLHISGESNCFAAMKDLKGNLKTN